MTLALQFSENFTKTDYQDYSDRLIWEIAVAFKTDAPYVLVKSEEALGEVTNISEKAVCLSSKGLVFFKNYF